MRFLFPLYILFSCNNLLVLLFSNSLLLILKIILFYVFLYNAINFKSIEDVWETKRYTDSIKFFILNIGYSSNIMSFKIIIYMSFNNSPLFLLNIKLNNPKFYKIPIFQGMYVTSRILFITTLKILIKTIMPHRL